MQPSPTIRDSSYRCIECGYDLSGTAIGGQCPECGRATIDSLRSREIGDRRSVQATASMILGILGLVLFPFFGLLAWYLASKAREEFAAGGFDATSRGMATAGLVMGIIGTIVSALWAVYMVVFLIVVVM